MTEERFRAYILVAEEPELLEAFRERLVTATNRQLGEAWQKGIVPPLPTFENLAEYRARTAERQEKRLEAA